MASDHVNRANRPNTWPHRPTLRRVTSFGIEGEVCYAGQSRLTTPARLLPSLTHQRHRTLRLTMSPHMDTIIILA